jgi:hypothetical protein
VHSKYYEEYSSTDILFAGKKHLILLRGLFEVCGLAVVRRCYADGGGDCYAKL